MQNLLNMEELATTPFLILGNKIDLPGAVSEEELRARLGLYQTTGKVRQRALSLGRLWGGRSADTRSRGHATGLWDGSARARSRSKTSGPSRYSCAPWSCGRVTATVRTA